MIRKAIYKLLKNLNQHCSTIDNRGIGVVEVILILVVLIGLVLIFKSQLTSLVGNIFEKITSESSGI